MNELEKKNDQIEATENVSENAEDELGDLFSVEDAYSENKEVATHAVDLVGFAKLCPDWDLEPPAILIGKKK